MSQRSDELRRIPAPRRAAAPVPADDAALAEEAARFGRVFEANIVGVIVADLAGHITDANDCFLSMVGYERADLPLRWDAMTPLKWHAVDEGKIRELRATGEAQNWDKEYLHKEGGSIPITVCAMLLGGAEDACIAVVLDRTEQRRMEDAQRRRDKEYQHRLRALALEVSVTAERERHRIAQGLHDQIGQTLAVARMKIGSLREAELDPAAATAVEELANLLRRTVDATRSLTFDLSPPLLYELGLEAALRGLADHVEQRHAIPCSFATDGQPVPMPIDAAVVVHQVVRELLFNIVKHARAKSARIAVTRAGDRMRVDIEDDGVGFESTDDDPTFDAKGGFGLFSSRERVRELGGVLNIDSVPGQGTRVVLTVPLAPSNGDGA